MTRAMLSTFVGGAMLSLAGIGIGSPAAAHEDLQSFMFEYTPAGEDDCVVKVGLNDSGLWSEVLTQRLICNFTVGATWQVLPQKASAIFRMRAPSIPPPMPQPRAYSDPAWIAGNPMEATSDAEVHFHYFQAFAFNADDPGPIGRCQNGARAAEKEGADMHQLLSTGFFAAGTTAVAQLELRYLPSPHSHAPYDAHDNPYDTLSVFSERLVPVTVRCVGDPKIADSAYPPPKRQSLRVTGASLQIRPGGKVEAACPVEVTFRGRMSTAGKGPAEVKYRFRWATGAVSTVFSTIVEDSSVGAYVTHKVPIPLPPAIKPQGGGPASGAGDFAVLDESDPLIPPQAKGPTLAGTPAPSNVHKDSVRLEVVSPQGGVFSSWERYHVDCQPFVVTSAWLKYEVETKPTCPKKVTETVTFNGNQAGKLAYEIRHQGGMVFHSGQAEVNKQGQKYVGVATRNLTIGAFDGDIMADVKNSPANSGWVRLKIECLELSGDFSFIDNGGTKCPRQGKALINFVTNMQGNIHYSLDCTNGHFSGVAQTVKSPKGGYVAPALASFDIKQTTQANCALKTVAPGDPKVHSLKGHLFQCVKPTGVSGTSDLTPPSRPDPAPGGPGRVIDPPRPAKIACAGGLVKYGKCTCDRTHKLQRIGKNAWRCVKIVVVDPPRTPPPGRITIPPKPTRTTPQPPRITCVGGKVSRTGCVCPAGTQRQMTGRNAYRCAKIVKLQLTPAIKGCPKGRKRVNGKCIKPAG